MVRTGVPFDVMGDGSDLRIVTQVRPGTVNAAGEIPLELKFLDGSSGLFVARIASPVGVPQKPGSATRAALATPHPNPRVGAAPVMLRFALEAPAVVRFSLHDLSGREIVARETEYFSAAGSHGARWNPGRVPPGVYFVRLELDPGASAVTRCVMIE